METKFTQIHIHQKDDGGGGQRSFGIIQMWTRLEGF